MTNERTRLKQKKKNHDSRNGKWVWFQRYSGPTVGEGEKPFLNP